MSGDNGHSAVEAHLAILSLEGEYGRTWDTADAEGWADLYTDDGVFEMIAVPGLRGERIEGRQELIAFCERINERLEGLHLLHVPSISIDGDRARGWIHFEFRSRSKRAGSAEMGHTMGVYQVDYVRTAAGWRMKLRTEKAVSRSLSSFYGVPHSLP